MMAISKLIIIALAIEKMSQKKSAIPRALQFLIHCP